MRYLRELFPFRLFGVHAGGVVCACVQHDDGTFRDFLEKKQSLVMLLFADFKLGLFKFGLLETTENF